MRQNESQLHGCWPICGADFAQWNISLVFFITTEKSAFTAGVWSETLHDPQPFGSPSYSAITKDLGTLEWSSRILLSVLMLKISVMNFLLAHFQSVRQHKSSLTSFSLFVIFICFPSLDNERIPCLNMKLQASDQYSLGQEEVALNWGRFRLGIRKHFFS